MRYRLTFKHGFSHVFEADRLEDDDIHLALWLGDKLVARYSDSDIERCECLDDLEIYNGETYGKDGVKLFNLSGSTIACYRSTTAAKE